MIFTTLKNSQARVIQCTFYRHRKSLIEIFGNEDGHNLLQIFAFLDIK